MPRSQPEHPYDSVANELMDWLQTEPDYYIEALKGGARSPFAAAVPETAKLDYYRRQVYMQNPDGSVNYEEPNKEGRDMLIKRVGIKGYTQIMSATMPKAQAQPEPDDEDYESDLPEMPTNESSMGGY